jgi:outer membrane protein assembly factor BamB
MRGMFTQVSLRRGRAIAAILAAWAVVLFAGTAIGQGPSANPESTDWPRWMGPKMDGVWRVDGIMESLPVAGPPVKWRQPIGPGYTGPSVSAGRVFVMDRIEDKTLTPEQLREAKKAGRIPGKERVLCLDHSTGQPVWEHVYDCTYSIAYPSGPRCTPQVDGDLVYTLGAMGDLICFQVGDGKIVWQTKFSELAKTGEEPAKPPFWGYASHPMIDGPRLIVPVGGDGSAVMAFDKLTGKEIWRNVTSSDIAYAPLVFYGDGAGRQVIFWHADGIEGLKPETGEQFWHVKWPEEQQQPGATTSIVTPQIVGDLYYISEYFAGSLLLRLKSDPPGAEELFRSVTDDPRHEKALNSLMTTPVIRDGLVYGLTGDGLMRCNRLESGELVWEEKTAIGDKPQEFGTLFIVEQGGRFFSLDDHGRLSIMRLSADGMKVESSCQLIKATQNARGRTVVWSHPAFAGTHIIARNDEEIVCFDLSAAAPPPSG